MGWPKPSDLMMSKWSGREDLIPWFPHLGLWFRVGSLSGSARWPERRTRADRTTWNPYDAAGVDSPNEHPAARGQNRKCGVARFLRSSLVSGC